MALQLHMSGVSSLHSVCHTRPRFPSSATGISPGLVGIRTGPDSKQCTSSRRDGLRLRRAVQCTAVVSKAEIVDKRPEHDQRELPPLLASLAVEGLPPCRGSVYAPEALAYSQTMGPTDLLEPYYVACNSLISFVHCGVVSADRLAAMAGVGTLMTFLDDVLFDEQDVALLEKLGIDPTILASPESIMQYLRALDALMRQEERPASPTALKDMVWKVGRDLRTLSPSLEWFNQCVDALMDFYTANYECYRDILRADRDEPLLDLTTFTAMRYRTVGGLVCTHAVQFCQNSFLPSEIRKHPVVERLNALCITYSAYIQDIFSYSRELAEGSTNNLLDVLMASEPGMTLPQAAWKAVNMTRALAQKFLELEALQLPSWEEEPWASNVRLYVEGLKEAMSGFLYWHNKQKRYRRADAPFPELRDVNISFLPEPDSLKVICK